MCIPSGHPINYDKGHRPTTHNARQAAVDVRVADGFGYQADGWSKQEISQDRGD